MRYLYIILLLFLSNLSMGQVKKFDTIETKIGDLINKNLWDEVMLLAPDLIIEDPSRGEGHYYTGMALYKLGQEVKAMDYLAKAEDLADKNLKEKIFQLKTEIQTSKQQGVTVEKIRQLEKEGQYEQAAQSWKKLWLTSKSTIAYGLNAVENYIILEQYVNALEILKDPIIYRDPQAKKVIEVINLKPEMVIINGYNDAMVQGKESYRYNDFHKAISDFEKALKFKPYDKEARRYRVLALDEIAWQEVKKTNTIEAYEQYLSGDTSRTHSNEAHANIQKELIAKGEKYAAENDTKEMETYLNKYLRLYPDGPDAKKVKLTMCDVYFKNGNAAATIQEFRAQSEALYLFGKVKDLCPDAYAIDNYIHEATKLQKRYGRPDRFFFTFVNDPISTYGISYGSINTKGLGLYFTGRSNADIFKYGSYFTIDNSGEITGDVFGRNVKFTGNQSKGNAEAVLGLTKKITYPVWVYAGAGGAYNPVYWEAEVFNGNGAMTHEKEWARNTDETTWSPVIEAGIITDLRGFHLKGGFKTHDFSAWHLSVGIGFSVKR